MFVAAVVGYLLVSSRVPKDDQLLKLKSKLAEPKDSKDQDDSEEHKEAAPKTVEALDDVLSRALAAGKELTVFFEKHPGQQFRRQFFRGLFLLWLAVSLFAVLHQLLQGRVQEGLRVFAYGWLTCITTGLGAVPFMFIAADRISEESLAIANTVASGMMISASVGMVYEAHDHCGPFDWQILVGLLVGAVFMRVSQYLLGGEEEAGVAELHDAILERKHWRKAMLIFTVMFCHSAAEGIAVGVAFDKNLLNKQFGVYISILLAVHNMPEGLAVALVLVPRGISAPFAAVIATLTSVPQPLLAIVAFLFVDTFQCLLPVGLAFAAGAMVYVSLHELLSEAAEQLGMLRTFCITAGSFTLMVIVQVALHSLTEV